MIRCQEKHLAERATQRGYTMTEASACIVERHKDGTITVDETHPAYPRSKGLGDIVASGLSAVGITPERVSKAIGKKDCGCNRRKKALNEFGKKYFGIGND